MRTFIDLMPLADRAALWTALRQEALEKRLVELGEWRWDMNVAEQTLTFASVEDPAAALTVPAHLLASIAPGPRSLMWGWALPFSTDDGPAARLRTYGQEHGIASLAESELAFPELGEVPVREFVDQATADVGSACSEILGSAPFFAPEADGGTRAVLLLEIELEPITLQDAVISLPRILATGALRDPRMAIWGLGLHEGWQLTWEGDGFRSARLADGAARARFEFDELGRGTRASL